MSAACSFRLTRRKHERADRKYRHCHPSAQIFSRADFFVVAEPARGRNGSQDGPRSIASPSRLCRVSSRLAAPLSPFSPFIALATPIASPPPPPSQRSWPCVPPPLHDSGRLALGDSTRVTSPIRGSASLQKIREVQILPRRGARKGFVGLRSEASCLTLSPVACRLSPERECGFLAVAQRRDGSPADSV